MDDYGLLNLATLITGLNMLAYELKQAGERSNTLVAVWTC
jgi:hypothetical protein